MKYRKKIETDKHANKKHLILKSFENGASLQEIVREIGVSRPYARRVLYENGYITIPNDQAIRTALESGVTEYEVRATFHVSIENMAIIKHSCRIPLQSRIRTEDRDAFIRARRADIDCPTMDKIAAEVEERFGGTRLSRGRINQILKDQQYEYSG